MNITVTKNDSNTIFISLDGAALADSCVFRRQRGFWNKATEQWVAAKDFTPAKVKADPSLVTAYLLKTGTATIAKVSVAF